MDAGGRSHGFTPDDALDLALPRPVMLYAGRVSVEKGLDDFLKLPCSSSKVVVGDGPDRHELSQRYPAVRFFGYRFGRDLARHIAGSDVFVFPSRVDTFGLVMLEAMACGVPVAAYPVQGPVDVVVEGVSGALDHDLSAAIARALAVPRASYRAYALNFTGAGPRRCSSILWFRSSGLRRRLGRPNHITLKVA